MRSAGSSPAEGTKVYMVKQITTSELKEISFKKYDCLVDVRSPEEWSAFGKPDGETLRLSTYFISYQLKENRNIILNPNFMNDMNKLELNKNTRIFFICSSGIRSQLTAEIFTKKKFETYNVTDGFDGWLSNNLPIK